MESTCGHCLSLLAGFPHAWVSRQMGLMPEYIEDSLVPWSAEAGLETGSTGVYLRLRFLCIVLVPEM